MPFIPFEQRDEVRRRFRLGLGINEPGELSFLIAEAIDSFVGSQYNFERLAAALGAADSALSEFRRRVVEPYEDRKHAENGEVFTLSAGSPVTCGPGWPE